MHSTYEIFLVNGKSKMKMKKTRRDSLPAGFLGNPLPNARSIE